MFKRSILLAALCLGASAAVGESRPARASATAEVPRRAEAIHDALEGYDADGLNPRVLALALRAATCAVQSGDLQEPPPTLTVIDYSEPSTAKRLWVFDTTSHALLFHELVAHGQGSGDNLATRFSNEAESHQSSLGLFVTEDTYVGKNGYSLRMRGLEAGINDRAYDRAIVMHGAPYVSEAFAQQQGRLGRSWGCPAMSAPVARTVIDRVKRGGAVFAYFPNDAWLNSSKYLHDCQQG